MNQLLYSDNGVLIAEPWNPATPLPEAFYDIAAQIYQQDAIWLGEDKPAIDKKFSPANSWFEQGHAWLGLAQGTRLVGFDAPYQNVDGQRAAFFGYWESCDDVAVNRTLFEALKRWAKNSGATHLYGPINFTTYDKYRLRTSNFESGAFIGEPWNPPYYANLLEQLGFAPSHRYFSTSTPLSLVQAKIATEMAALQQHLDTSITLHVLTPEFWLAHLEDFYQMAHTIFKDNVGYSPIDFNTFLQSYGAGFTHLFCPRTSLYAKAADGSLAGFLIAVPDYAPYLRTQKHSGGNKAFHYASCFDDLPHPKMHIVKSLGVMPAFRAKKLTSAMVCESLIRAHGWYDEAMGALVRADNKSAMVANRFGISNREYALYGCEL